MKVIGLNGLFDQFRSVMISGRKDLERFIKDMPFQAETALFAIEQKNTLIIYNIPESSDEPLMRWLSRHVDDAELFLGVSEVVDRVECIPDSVEQAKTAYYYSFMDTKTKVHLFKPESLTVLKMLLNEFDTLMPELPGSIGKIHALIEQIPGFLRKNQLSITSLTMVYNHVIGLLNGMLMARQTQTEQVLKPFDPARLVSTYEDLDGALMFLHENVQSASRFVCTKQEQENQAFLSTNKSVIATVKQYIDQNYKKNITLGQLAEKFLIDERYLSQLFKQETGENFITYLTTLRLKNACSLLKYTDLTIQAISELCGYNDYFYFNKVFKKNIGMTPKSYRNESVEAF